MIFEYIVLYESNIRDYLLSYYVSKSFIYKLFLEKRIKVNGIDINERYIVKKDDIITIDEKVEVQYEPLDKKLDIIYEDSHILIINKPKGIIIHDEKNSLCNIVQAYYNKNNIKCNIYFAHRLDIDTTGIILFVKDHITLSYFDHYFSTHEFKREYRLLVNGHLKNKNGVIDRRIGSDRHINNKYVVSKTGKDAITYYSLIKEYKNYSYVSVNLKTGRTHQIRCHMSYLGNPLLGDRLYGSFDNLIDRVALHSYKINYIDPYTRKEMEFKCDLPSDMKELI
jgi:23S rRNA pseudouridine1911/1915/1917 synthase